MLVLRRRAGLVAVIGITALAGCSSTSSPLSSGPSSASTTAAAVVATTVAPVSTSPVTTVVVATTTLDPTTIPVVTPPPTVAPAAPETAVPTSIETTVAATPDAATLLHSALDQLGSTYHFNGTATVNGAAALAVDGDHVGDGSRFAVTANGATVSYIVLPTGTWVQQSDAGWEALTDPPASVDPIDALGAPTSVTLTGGDAQNAQLDVAVPAAALGLEGDADVTVQAVITAGLLTSVAYSAVVDGTTAQVATSLAPAVDGSPVVAPV